MKRSSYVLHDALAMAKSALQEKSPSITKLSRPENPLNDYTPPQFKRPDRKQWRGKKRGRK